MIFDPKPTKYPFPKFTDEHYLVVKKNNGLVFDEHYPFVDKSKGFLFKQFLTRILLYVIVFPVSYIYLGLRIKGRKNLKIHKNELKDGFVNVSNHIHLWDYIALMNALRPRRTNVLVWAPNIRGENGKLMRMVGGIPLPENTFEATKAFKDAVGNLLGNKGILQIYGEGSMWEYYQPIRPFKTGPAKFACMCDKPLLPCAFSYRKPSWFRKHIMRQEAAITLTIGAPLHADKSLSKRDQELDLTKRAHEMVCYLAGIDPSENIYPPIFSKNEKVEYY